MKKELLIIPDIHGRDFWKEAVERKDYEKIIFLGDYTDPYDMEGITNEMTIDNFKSIIAYKQQNPDKVVLLLGNHDLHYYSEYFYELAGSSRYNPLAANTFQHLFLENSQLFQLAYETDWGGKHYLFSHAGVTQSWLKRNLDLITIPDAKHLNHLLHTHEGLEALAQVGAIRWGSYPSGSMVWADIEEMMESGPLPNTYQIIGHSMQFDDPVITDHFACLDCRAAFILNNEGKIKQEKPSTEFSQ